MENGNQTSDADVGIWYSSLAYDQWVTLPVAGRRPPGRYKVIIVLLNFVYQVVFGIFGCVAFLIILVLRKIEGVVRTAIEIRRI